MKNERNPSELHSISIWEDEGGMPARDHHPSPIKTQIPSGLPDRDNACGIDHEVQRWEDEGGQPTLN